jgi:DNA-binding CsgD family transcriptional regulator
MCEAQETTTNFQKIDNFIAAISGADTLEGIFNVIRPEIESLGFERFAYWLVWPPEGPRIPLYINSYPPDWIKFYTDEHLSNDDVIMKYANLQTRPYSWSEAKNRFDLTKRQRLVFGLGSEAGLSSGATVPINGPGKARAVFSVANRQNEGDFALLFNEMRHALHLFATYAHEKILALELHKKKPNPSILTPREIETLTWTSRGKTRWEISKILGISEETTKFHIENCCAKLEAQNKTHAAAIALINGLISP